MTNKTLITLLGFLGFLLLVIMITVSQAKSFGVSFSNPTNGATTTATLPVLVLEENAQRVFASIQNDSDTDIYLHFGYYADADTASTSVLVNEGFRLLPSAANEFIIEDENLYTGQVWATSSAASKNIIYIEK